VDSVHPGCTQKLFGVPHGQRRAPLTWLSQPGLAGFETFGGLIYPGLFTRPVAFLLCGEMAVSTSQVHAPKGFSQRQRRPERRLFCFIFLTSASRAGDGRWR
jgi:putative oxidoreductase